MDMQDVSNLQIPEGAVRIIHDKDNRLIWGYLAYDAKYTGNAFQQTYSGNNLLPNGITSQSFHGVTITKHDDGSLTLNGLVETGSPNYSLTLGSFSAVSGVKYTISGVTGWNYNTLQLFGVSSVAFPAGNRIQCHNGPQTVTAQGSENVVIRLFIYPGQNYENVVIYPMVEQSDFATAYEPYTAGPSPNPDYPQDINVVTGAQTITISDGTNSHNYTVNLGSTELCKIDTYQDYIYKGADGWYVHKETGSVTYVGGASENWDLYGSGTSVFRIRILDMKGQDNQQQIAPLLCNYYTPIDYAKIINPSYWPDYGIAGMVTSASGIAIRNKDCANVTAFKTWLSAHNTTVYYAISTPTDTKITDATLIGQLNTLHQWTTRYGYNATVIGNLPIIINKTSL